MNKPNNYAKDSIVQFTLREMQTFATNPKFWTGMVVATIILGVSGPFSTLNELNAVPRFAYWGGICIFTFFANLSVVLPIVKLLGLRKTPKFLNYLIAGVAGSIPVTLVVWFLSVFLAGNIEPTFAELIDLWTKCAPIVIAITIANLVFLKTDNAVDGSETSKEPAFFQRLSVELGKQVYALQSQDHYVQVTTARGKEMILIRLEDAMKELDGIDGLRVHRSWWVASRAVSKLEKEDGKTLLILKDSTKIPVSRTYIKQVRAMFSDV